MNNEIKEILHKLNYKAEHYILYNYEVKLLLDYITNLQQENERLNKEVAKLHIIQEEYGNHIENTHIIDDYQKTYFMSNKWLIELKNGKFVYIDDLNDKYEDYKSKVDNALKIIEKEKENMGYAKYDSCLLLIENILQNGSDTSE